MNDEKKVPPPHKIPKKIRNTPDAKAEENGGETHD